MKFTKDDNPYNVFLDDGGYSRDGSFKCLIKLNWHIEIGNEVDPKKDSHGNVKGLPKMS